MFLEILTKLSDLLLMKLMAQTVGFCEVNSSHIRGRLDTKAC